MNNRVVDQGPGVGDPPVSISGDPVSLAQAWLAWLVDVRGRSERTFNAYAVILRQYLSWCEENRLDALQPVLEDLEAFVQRPRGRQAKGKRGAPATQRQDVVILKGWFDWLVRRGHVSVDPTLDLFAPTVRPNLPKPVPDEHWLVMWGADKNPRLHLALGLGYFVGLRRQEMALLRGTQFTEDRIVRFKRKGGGEDTTPWRSMLEVYQENLPHLAPKGDEWAERLLEHARAVRGERMCWRDGHQFYKNMVELCGKLGIPAYTPHQLRHSCATNLLRAEVPLHITQRLMNHSSQDMTMRYVRAGADELDAWRRQRRQHIG